MFDRRSLIKSAAGSMAGAFLAPAFASSVLSPDDKLMPVDTRNGRSGWDCIYNGKNARKLSEAHEGICRDA